MMFQCAQRLVEGGSSLVLEFATTLNQKMGETHAQAMIEKIPTPAMIMLVQVNWTFVICSTI